MSGGVGELFVEIKPEVDAATFQRELQAKLASLGQSLGPTFAQAGKVGATQTATAFGQKLRDEKGRFLKAGGDAGKTFGDALKAEGSKAGGSAGKETGRRFGAELGTALQGLGAFAAARKVQQFFVGAKDAALEFETAFAGVRKTVDASPAEFAAMEDAIREMATQLPFTAVGIASVAETAGQLGVAKANILDFSQTVLQLGETTNLTAEEAATAFAQIANITGLPQDRFENLAGAVVALGNAGATTERDIVTLALRIAGAGRSVGLTTSEVVGFGAALANVGINAEAGGTAISRVFITILSAVETGGQKLESFAKLAGRSVPEFARLFREDAAEATILFVEGLARLQEQGGSTTQALDELGLADIRVSDTIRRLIPGADQLRATIALGNDEFERGTASSDEFAKRLDTNASKLTILSNRFNETKIKIGEVVAEGLIPVTDLVSGLPAPLVAAAAGFAGLAAAGVGVAAVLKILDATETTLGKLGGARGQKAVDVMGKLGKAIGGALAIAGIIEGARALGEFLDQAARDPENPEKLASSLRSLAAGALSVQEVLQRGGATGDDQGFFARLVADLPDDIEAVRSELAKFSALGGSFNTIELASGFKDIDKALTDLLAGDKADEAGIAFLRLRKEIGATDPRATALLFPVFSEALETTAAAARGAADATAASADTFTEAGGKVEATARALLDFAKDTSGIGDPLAEFAGSVSNLDDLLASSGIPFRASELKEALGQTGPAALAAQQALTGVDKALADLASRGGVALALETAGALSTQLQTDTRQTFPQFVAAVDEARIAGTDQADASLEQQAALAELGVEADETASAFVNLENDLKDWRTTLDQSLGIVLDSREAYSNYQGAIDDVAASLKENGSSFKLSTEAGRDNDAAVRSLIESTFDYVDAQAASAVKAGEAFNKQDTLRGLLETIASKSVPAVRTQIQKYIDLLPAVEVTKTTTFKTPGLTKAVEDVNSLGGLLSEIPPSGSLTIKSIQSVTGTVNLSKGGSSSNPLFVKPVGGVLSTQHLGGWILAPGASPSDIPIVAQAGEFMHSRPNAELTRSVFGAGFLDQWNRATSREMLLRLFAGSSLRRFHEGGAIPASSSSTVAVPIPFTSDALLNELRALRGALALIASRQAPITITGVTDPEAVAFAVTARQGLEAIR